MQHDNADAGATQRLQCLRDCIRARRRALEWDQDAVEAFESGQAGIRRDNENRLARLSHHRKRDMTRRPTPATMAPRTDDHHRHRGCGSQLDDAIHGITVDDVDRDAGVLRQRRNGFVFPFTDVNSPSLGPDRASHRGRRTKHWERCSAVVDSGENNGHCCLHSSCCRTNSAEPRTVTPYTERLTGPSAWMTIRS
jgi:hypothetical protein